MPTTNDFVERRRVPRIAVGDDGPTASLPATVTVQILDISGGGALMAAPQNIDVGTIAWLRTRVGAHPVSTQAEVRRVETRAGQDSAFKVGVRFRNMDAVTRGHIEALLRPGM